jgi:hypothetical protein
MLGEEYKLWSSSLCSFLHPPVTLSLFGPNILLNTLFSNTQQMYTSDNIWIMHSTPLYISFLFLAGKFRGKRTDVFISLFINRVSAVDESKEVSELLFSAGPPPRGHLSAKAKCPRIRSGCSAVEETCRLTINSTYCRDKIRSPDEERISPLMTSHSAIGSYNCNLWEMLCPLYAAGMFPLSLNALYVESLTTEEWRILGYYTVWLL